MKKFLLLSFAVLGICAATTTVRAGDDGPVYSNEPPSAHYYQDPPRYCAPPPRPIYYAAPVPYYAYYGRPYYRRHYYPAAYGYPYRYAYRPGIHFGIGF